MVKFFYNILAALTIVACSTTTPIPNPDDCGSGKSFNQKSKVLHEACVAINPNLFHSNKKKIWGRTDAFWPQNSTITVKFLNGTSNQQNLAWKRFETLNSLMNIKYVKSTGNTNIRVMFDPEQGHWSYIGVWNKQIPQSQRTMNLGLVGNEGNDEWDRVCLHEILHSAGFFHELQHPYYQIPWDEQKVLEYYRRTQGWSDEQIHEQVLDRADPTNFEGTNFDPNSIMCYPVDPSFTNGKLSVGWNYKLSPCDVKEIQKVYPISK